jgi:hypothetical protein
VSKKAVDWVHSLSREQVSPVERDLLLARAQLASEKEHLSFASNGTLAAIARTTRLYVIECNQSLIRKKLMVEATIPRFKTETRWYFLAVGVTDLDIFTSVCRHTRPHPHPVVPLVCASTPYSDKTKNRTKASVAGATLGHTNSLPTPPEKREPRIRTKKSPLPPFAPGEEVFQLFWDAFPPSWKKRGKEKVRAHFFRLGVGKAWYLKRWLPAIQNVNCYPDGRPREVEFLISPEKFLVDRRYTDEN